jgi:hypothetical protein
LPLLQLSVGQYSIRELLTHPPVDFKTVEKSV